MASVDLKINHRSSTEESDLQRPSIRCDTPPQSFLARRRSVQTGKACRHRRVPSASARPRSLNARAHPNIGPKNHKGPLVCPQLFPMRKLLSSLCLRTAPNSIATLQVGSCSSELWNTGTPQSGILQNRCNCKPIFHLVCFVTLKHFCTLHSSLTYLPGMSWLHRATCCMTKRQTLKQTGCTACLLACLLVRRCSFQVGVCCDRMLPRRAGPRMATEPTRWIAAALTRTIACQTHCCRARMRSPDRLLDAKYRTE